MKKAVVLVSMLAASLLVGCKITPEQSKVIAQNAGLYSAVIWIAVDNPDTNQIASVVSILNVISEKAYEVKAGQTYTEVIYPELVKVIDTKIKPQDRPICKAASLSLLNGLDTLFAMHPEWKTVECLAIDITNSYILGAKIGLSMDAKNPIMIQARANAATRAKLLK